MSVSRTAILENIAQVQARIEASARRAGRDRSQVSLVAVTKGHPPELIREAHAAGLRHFGENRIEEALPKLEALADLRDATWHMVGHIQSRKAAEVAPQFEWVHSVDRLKIARRLDRFAGEAGLRLTVLLECNVSGEGSKYGWPLNDAARWPAVIERFKELQKLSNLKIRGLMTIAPWTEDESVVRSTFRRLRELRDFLANEASLDWPELSMGMTDDYEIAIEEGATILRVGRALFGPRPTG